MRDTLVFERGEHVYLVAPVAPFSPSQHELEELAFADALREQAPNPKILWMRGPFVEADRANANGAEWSADELAIKSLTPRLMPVTVMHDPRTAVGLIADTRLLTRERDAVPRSRIDTTLGVWAHRFPEVAEEAQENYKAGTLMQSMECLPAYYDCGECGRRFPKLPGGAEEANWCAHLRGEENAKATRRLGNVTFTGTGLIFGSRGSRGAYDDANLEVLEDEVAEFHERAKSDTRRYGSRRQVDEITIKRDEYDQLKAAAARVGDLEAKVTKAEEQATKAGELEKKVEETETAKVAAERERDEAKGKVEEYAERERTATLAKERLGKLGKGFTGKLGDFTRGRLEEQAGKLSDEEWDARLQELEETAGVKRDEGGAAAPAGGNGGGSDGTFSREEIARSGAGGGATNGGDGGTPSPEARRSVVAGLVGAKRK